MLSETPQGHNLFFIFSCWLCLAGWAAAKPTDISKYNLLASDFLAPAGAQAQCGTVGGRGEGRSWQEGALCPANPQKASLCVSSHPLLLVPSPRCRKANTAHYPFILESTAFGVPITSGQRAHNLKTIKRYKTGIGNDW